MKRVLFSMTVLLLALVAAQDLAAQKKGTGILSGVVLGPDDRPVSHASVSYQSSAGMAPHEFENYRSVCLRGPLGCFSCAVRGQQDPLFYPLRFKPYRQLPARTHRLLDTYGGDSPVHLGCGAILAKAITSPPDWKKPRSTASAGAGVRRGRRGLCRRRQTTPCRLCANQSTDIRAVNPTTVGNRSRWSATRRR